ncbi:calcium-binding protein [Roseivivax sp. CAU 1753]
MEVVFGHVGSMSVDHAQSLEGVRAFALHDGADGATLQVISGQDGATGLTAWDLTGTGPVAEDQAVLSGGPVPGITPEITGATLASGQEVALVTGTGDAGLVMVRVEADGAFGAEIAINAAAAGVPGDLSDVAWATTATGTYLYGIAPGSQTPMVWQVSATGQLTLLSSGSRASPSGGIAAPGLTDLEVIDGQLVASGTGTTFLVSYDIAANGTLSSPQVFGPEQNPGIAGETTLETVTLGGTSFVILGAAQTGTLSVYALNGAGQLTLVDHLMDGLESRFQGVTALDAVVIDGVAYLAAGGGDGGVSLFRITDQGDLVHLGVLEDSVQTAVNGIGSLALYETPDGGLGLATLGLADGGISQFSISLSGQMHLDDAGADTLSGGTGSDLFVLTADAAPDRITGFDPAEDTLDLSGWAFYRDVSQLSINATATGAEIRFMSLVGEEVLIVESVAGTPLSPDLVAASIAPAPSRFLPEWLSPVLTPAPVDASVSRTGSTGNDTLETGSGNDTITGRGGSDVISGGAGRDNINGGIGADTLLGGDAEDTISGLDGYDVIDGGAGADSLMGNAGADQIQGGAGADTLIGGNAADQLRGGDDDDWLQGDDGADELWGDAGADTIFGNAGTDFAWGGAGGDRIEGGINHDTLFGEDGSDTLSGDGGDDSLDGGGGRDSLMGGGGRDVLHGGGDADTLDGGISNDTLSGDAGNDLLIGKNGSDWLDGGAGNDTLYGGAGNDTLTGGGGTDVLDGSTGADTFIFSEGNVVITEFQNDVDTLVLDAALWGGAALDAEAMVDMAEVVDGDLVFAFDDARLVIEGLSNPNALLNDILLL